MSNQEGLGHTLRDTTATASAGGWLALPSEGTPRPPAHALVIAWSMAEPERCGDVALLGDASPSLLLGRGSSLADDDAPRVRFVRQRPGLLEPRGPLASPGLSRRQLRLTPRPEGLAFERVGRCAVLHNGVARNHGVLRLGDVLTLQQQLVLYYQRRSTTFVAAAAAASTRSAAGHPFGTADADGIVGESEAAFRLREDLAMVAASGAHVLVLGPSGSGKELAAHAIHRLSPRRHRPFVARNAAAIPTGLIDAELFGNRRDYPNAGMPEREGVVGAASGGTLFLDEIGELSPELQTHLLRLLDAAGEYHRLGEATARRSDLRLVAATNRPLSSLKHDFAARFAVRLNVPGLDARREDLPLLLRQRMEVAASSVPELRARFFESASDGASYPRVDPAFVEALLQWRWSSHARELQALLWASIRASTGHYLVTPPEMASKASDGAEGDEIEASTIREVLAAHRGNQSKAYVALGLSSRFALYRLLRKHGIDAREMERRR